ncbi:MAG: hypothetical protein NC548_28810 [Lachnospiraceae bacterium]|nr:hypothetical protein [Lachnospiraceae bacterium]
MDSNGTRYEKGGIDMKAVMEAAKAQREQKQTTGQQRKPPVARHPVAVKVASDVSTAEHGDFVKTADGSGAILIDHEVEAAKMQSNDATSKSLIALVESPDLISDVNGYTPDYGEEAPENYDPGVQYINENPYEKKAMEMVKIKKGFAKLTYGTHGLVNADSEEGKKVEEALAKLRSGEVILPTPEEYEEQKREAARKRKERSDKLKGKKSEPEEKKEEPKQNTTRTVAPRKKQTQSKPVEEEIQMAEMPENYIMKKGAVEQMSEMNEKSTPVTPVRRAPVATTNGNTTPPKKEETVTKADAPVAEPKQAPKLGAPAGGLIIDTPAPKNKPEPIPEEEPVEQAEETAEENKGEQRGVLNLGELEAEAEDMKHESGEEPAEGEEAPANDDKVTIINVPEGQVGDVIRQLPPDTYDKLVSSKVVQINEVELKDVPVATRRITDINDYKALKKIRPQKQPEITERALINSGFVVTLKGATSMEMSSIFVSMNGSDIDWGKTYQFCYEHTIGTSIGRLGYTEYVAKVDPADIETILDGIYEISEHDEISVQVNCQCGLPYDVKVKTATLATPNRLPQESMDRVKEILDARNDMERAQKVQESSPTVTAKYIQSGDKTIVIRTTTGDMMITRIDEINRIAEEYNGAIAAIALFVEKVLVEAQFNENSQPEVYELTDLDIICEELKQLEDEELGMVKDMISGLKQYETVQYTLKGPFQCPNCGHTDREVGCTIADLVFQKVQRALA